MGMHPLGITKIVLECFLLCTKLQNMKMEYYSTTYHPKMYAILDRQLKLTNMFNITISTDLRSDKSRQKITNLDTSSTNIIHKTNLRFEYIHSTIAGYYIFLGDAMKY